MGQLSGSSKDSAPIMTTMQAVRGQQLVSWCQGNRPPGATSCTSIGAGVSLIQSPASRQALHVNVSGSHDTAPRCAVQLASMMGHGGGGEGNIWHCCWTGRNPKPARLGFRLGSNPTLSL
ncbi:unnamed protein product [Lota lota]